MRPVLLLLPTALALSFLASAGCKAKPSEKACKEAIQNVRRISGQDVSDIGADPSAAIRSCRANSSKESVECMRTAKTLADLQVCEGEAGEKYFQQAAEETKKAEERNAGHGESEDKKVEEASDAAPTVEDAIDAAAAVEDTDKAATPTDKQEAPVEEAPAEASPDGE